MINNTTNIAPDSLGIRCTQANLQKAITPTTSFEQWMESGRTEVGLIQEPYLKRNKVSGFKNFNVFRGAPFGKIRAVVITKKSVNAWLLNQFSNPDQVAISIKLRNKTVVLASVYMPYDPTVTPISNILANLIKFCKEKKV